MPDQLTFYARVHRSDYERKKKTPQSAQKTYCSAVILRAFPRSLFRSCIRVRSLPGTRSVQCSCVVISSTLRRNARNIRFIPPPVLRKKSNDTNVPLIVIKLVFLTHTFEAVLPIALLSPPHHPVLLLSPSSITLSCFFSPLPNLTSSSFRVCLTASCIVSHYSSLSILTISLDNLIVSQSFVPLGV